MSNEKEQSNNDLPTATDERDEHLHENTNPQTKKRFVEPSISSPVKVLEATRFLQGGSQGGGEILE
jgi:hypothetical protein